LTSEFKADNFYVFMTVIIIVSLVFPLGLALGAAVIWYILRRREPVELKEPEKKKAEASLAFHWKYVVLPATILLLSIVLAAVFYPQLSDQVAWRFNLDGSAKGWLSRQMITLLMLLPQFLLVLAASAITWGITKMGRSLGQMGSALKPESFILLMGNMAALPQIVLAFVMLDIFSYNIYQRHLMPIWLFALIVILAGGIILSILFIRTIRLSRSISDNIKSKNYKEL
jgi:uncharacterized membrane protein